MSDKSDIGPVVSAAHLARGAMPSLSELEFALNVAGNAWHRWMVRCAAAAGMPAQTATEVLLLHYVNHRGRDKTLADLCLLMNIEDTHLINYALKKLEAAGMLKSGKRGKEKTLAATTRGIEACERYHAMRETLLVESVLELGLDPAQVSRMATLLRTLSGQYDQAARSAASM